MPGDVGWRPARHADGSRRIDPEYDDRSAEAALAHFVDEALGREHGREVILRSVCDHPAPGLLSAAADADLLVVGARGLGGFRGLLLGSVSQQCLHHASGAIAVVHGESAEGHDTMRVVVGVDGSESSAAALRWAVAAATARHGVPDVVHAWETPVIYGPSPDHSGPRPASTDDAVRLVEASLIAVGRVVAAGSIDPIP